MGEAQALSNSFTYDSCFTLSEFLLLYIQTQHVTGKCKEYDTFLFHLRKVGHETLELTWNHEIFKFFPATVECYNNTGEGYFLIRTTVYNFNKNTITAQIKPCRKRLGHCIE